MPSLKTIAYYTIHMNELRSMLQWKLWHDPVHERDVSKESATLKECFKYLHQTSRSFVAVILELHPELLVPVTVFYLILRGLDTIEDDMTISIEEKEPLLRDFQNIVEKDGWTYDGNGPNEKDRNLLVHFDCVITEFKLLKPEYREIIKDITKRMGHGMADYVLKNADGKTHRVESIKEYELYCHYVAGLVGEGCTRLFVEAKLANPILLKRADLHESMGQFLQQVNIIRDIREDHEDKRYFWPQEVWSKHVDKFEDLFAPENEEKALACSSEMILMALNRADDCLFYLAGIRDQSVFNFCAIPQSMAIATLEVCFRNPALFQRNVKITKGVACDLMTKSTQNLQMVCQVFRTFARKIHKKNDQNDPNFLNISIACAKVEKFIESIFPSQTAATVKAGQQVVANTPALTPEEEAKKAADDAEAKSDVFYLFLAVFGTLFFITLCMIGAAWFFGARFDFAWDQLKNGAFAKPSDKAEAEARLAAFDATAHAEL